MTEKEKERISISDLHELTTLLDKIGTGGVDRQLIADYLDMLLTMRITQFEESGLQHQLERKLNTLSKYRTVLHRLYHTYSEVILEKKSEIFSGQKVRDLSQPKYKLSACEEILGKTRQTLNNWTKSGALRFYDIDNKAKCVLESDLKSKYKEIHGEDLFIDDKFRSKYEYKL